MYSTLLDILFRTKKRHNKMLFIYILAINSFYKNHLFHTFMSWQKLMVAILELFILTIIVVLSLLSRIYG